MPLKKTMERARRAKHQGKSPSTQAGEFVREEIDEIRAGKHGARSARQAIAIGLSKARRAGVKLAAPRKGKASATVRKKAQRDLEKGRSGKRKVSRKRSLATTRALQREGRAAASKTALSRQTRSAAAKRTKAERSASARKAARTRAKRRQS